MASVRKLVPLVSVLACSTGWAQAPAATPDPGSLHRLVGLLQYLSADYPLAVQTQSEFELAEQRSFAAEAVEAAGQLGPAGRAIADRVAALRGRVDRSADPEGVSRECAALADELVTAFGLERSPRARPDLAVGKAVFAQSCAACHGGEGRADVELARGMEPPPANFHSAELMGELTPYRAFNTTGFGITGTAMPAFPTLTEGERWAVAFYTFTLRQPPCDHRPPAATLETLATSSDLQLAARYGEHEVACLRRMPPDVDEERALVAARTGVEEALKVAASGDFAAAKRALLDAYLNGLEPVEARLRSRDPAAVDALEVAFSRARVAAERKSPDLFNDGRALLNLIDDARRQHRTAGSQAVFWWSLLIVLREGFEAMIVVAALLAVLQKVGAPEQRRVVHLGWVAALVVGAAAYWLGRKTFAAASREWVEAIVALAAVGMLLYAILWLNSRAALRKHMGELRSRMAGALTRRSAVGLFVIAFTAVVRETFETALFLQGLAIDSARATTYGALAGFAALGLFVLGFGRVGYRLPMKALFQGSTVLLFGTAVVLLGKGLHGLQEVGVLPLAPAGKLRLDVLGLYPDWWSLLPQLALLVAPVAYWLLRRRSAPADAVPVAPGHRIGR